MQSNREKEGAAMTPAYIEYQRAFFGLMNFFQIDILLTESIPQILKELEHTNPQSFRQLAVIATANPDVRRPEVMQRIVMELIICRLVDHFKVYLCDVIENCLTLSPDNLVLTEKERKRIRERYQTTTEEELKTASIIDAVDKLSDGPLDNFVQFFHDTVGIDISIPDSETISECFAVRNIVVHTNGRVNLRFLNRTKRTDLKVGDYVTFTSSDCQRWSKAMDEAASSIDKSALDSIGRVKFMQSFFTFYKEFLSRQKSSEH
jgi:hypothetical protein